MARGSIVTDTDPRPVGGPAAWSVRVVARPLALTRDGWTVSALGVAYGRGLEDLATTHSFALDVLENGKTLP